MLKLGDKNYQSSPVIKRYANNPILSPKDVPYNPVLSFNAGVTKFNGKYVMAFRNDYQREGRPFGCIDCTKSDIGLAFSDDGIKWDVQPKACFRLNNEEYVRAYDPRLTVIDEKCYMCFAVDSKHGCYVAIAETEDFEKFNIISNSLPDNRNMVLFPEKINGKYVRLERPFSEYGNFSQDGWRKGWYDIWISESPDLQHWGHNDVLLSAEDVEFCNCKIGPSAPPIKTEKGWLTTFHSVYDDPSRGKNGWEESWISIYTTGLMLLDLENPYKIIGINKNPIFLPEAEYERKDGFRNDVIFVGGMVLEDDGEVKIYYGAADIVECLATAHVDDLIKLCLE